MEMSSLLYFSPRSKLHFILTRQLAKAYLFRSEQNFLFRIKNGDYTQNGTVRSKSQVTDTNRENTAWA